jgi:hypothetical protein
MTTHAPTALVLVGHPPFTDQWHDDAAVGHLVALELAALGFHTVLRGTMPWVLDDVEPGDLALLVVKAAGGSDEEGAFAGFQERLAALLAASVPVLALHQASGAFGNPPAWAAAVGGRWVDGTTWHPAISPALFRPLDDAHPVTAGLAPFTAYDETYLDLVHVPEIRPLVVVDHGEVAHPVVWQGPGPSKVIYDSLGHDARSFDSPGRVDLLRREVAWLTAP